MINHVLLAIAAQCCLLAAHRASAHPSSGIVVDEQGQVYFTAPGIPGTAARGFVWKIDGKKLTRLHEGGAHWLALDAKGSFSQSDLDGWFRQRTAPWLQRVALPNSKASLIQADGMPLVIHRDGNLYFAKGNVEIARLSPDGKETVLAPALKEIAEKFSGIKGLASCPDDSLYVACPSAVLKIKLDGAVSTLVHPIALEDCDADVADGILQPGLRGLAVEERGVVYAAATGCRRVVRITPDGKITTVLKSDPPWSPTGVAVQGGDVYVLEHAHANSDRREDWQPRVRKLGRDGKVTTLATPGIEQSKSPKR